MAVESTGTSAWRILLLAPGFVHIGLAIGAAAVALMVVVIPAGHFSLRELSLWSVSFWGLVAAAMAGGFAALVYACSGRRSRGSDAAAAIVRRAGWAAVIRFVAAQLVLIASLLLIACAAVIAFRNTVPGVFVAAAAAGCGTALMLALCFLDRSRFAALVDLTDGPAVPGGWRAAQIAHVHRHRVKAAVAWDAETAGREDRPSLASRLVPAGQAGDDGEARHRRVQLPDFRFSLARSVPGEARLRVRGLLPIVALAVPYAAAAAIAAAILTTPPSGPLLPMPGYGVAALRTGGLPDQGQQGAGGGGHGATAAGGDGQGRAGAGQSGDGNDGQGNAAADGGPAPGSSNPSAAGAGSRPGEAGSSPSTGGTNGPGTNGYNPSTQGAGDQPRAGGSNPNAPGAGGHPGTGGSGPSAAGGGGHPGAGGGLGVAGGQSGAGGNGQSTAGAGGGPGTGGAGADGAGPGRGDVSNPKAFVEGRKPTDGPNDGGGEIVVSGTGPGSDEGNSRPSAPDNALLRGVRQTPAPLIDWPPPSASPPDRASIPRPYQPRQALPAWAVPLVPGSGASARP